MLVLAIETSSFVGSLALLDGPSKVLFNQQWTREKSHSETITHFLDLGLKDAGMKVSDLDMIAVGIGPGSFTGLRVGVNLARALSYTKDIPIVGIDSLRILAQPALESTGQPVVAMVNAFRNRVYYARYENLEASPEPIAVSMNFLNDDVLLPHLTLGDAFDIFQSQFSDNLKPLLLRSSQHSDYPLAIELAKIITQQKMKVRPTSWKEVKPLYIRASSAEEKLREGSLKPLPTL